MMELIVYGAKFGRPEGLDLDFECLAFKNPHHDPKLRDLTGLDPEVIAAIRADAKFAKFAEMVESMIRDQNPKRVGFHCIGGRHRSVVVALEVARRLRAKSIYVSLRFLNKDVATRAAAISCSHPELTFEASLMDRALVR